MKAVLCTIPILFVTCILLTFIPSLPEKKFEWSNLPITVLDVAADPDIPGKAYVLTGWLPPKSCPTEANKEECYSNALAVFHLGIYESIDYGQTWRPRDFELATDATGTHIYHFTDQPRSDRLDLYTRQGAIDSQDKDNWRTIWKFPPSVFLSWGFVTPSGSSRIASSSTFPNVNRLKLEAVSVSQADPSVVYIGLGDYGVLVGPNPASALFSLRGWYLSHTGLPLTHAAAPNGGVQFPDFLMALALLIFLPPFPYLNGWLLHQAFRYAFQPGETQALRRYTWLVAGLITLGDMILLALPLTRTDFPYQTALTCLTILNIVGFAGSSWWISRKRAFSRRFTMQMMIGCVVLSLLVPLGLHLGILMWCILFVIWSVFTGMRVPIEHFLEREGLVNARWSLDQLTLRIVASSFLFYPAAGFLIYSISFLVFIAPTLMYPASSGDLAQTVSMATSLLVAAMCVVLFVLIAGYAYLIVRYVRHSLSKTKRKAQFSEAEISQMERSDRRFWYEVLGYLTFAPVVSGITCFLFLLAATTYAPLWYRLLQRT